MTSHAVRPAILVTALISEALASLAHGATRFFTAAVRDVRGRRAAAELRELDDRMLADIGLSRSGIEQAIRFGRPAISISSR